MVCPDIAPVHGNLPAFLPSVLPLPILPLVVSLLVFTPTASTVVVVVLPTSLVLAGIHQPNQSLAPRFTNHVNLASLSPDFAVCYAG